MKWFSHFTIKNANHDLCDVLIKDANYLGFTFKESNIKSTYQQYEVVSVTPGGLAETNDIHTGDTFYLPNEELDSVILSVDTYSIGYWKDSIDCTWNLLFYSKSLGYPKRLTDTKTYRSITLNPAANYVPKAFTKTYSEPFTITIPSFTKGNSVTGDDGYNGVEIASAMEYAIENNIKGIVIDLRNNTGGSPSNVKHLLSYFIAHKEPYSVRVGRKDWLDFVQSKDYTDFMRDHFGGELPPFKFSQLNQLLVRWVFCNRPTLVNKIDSFRPRLFNGKVAVLINSRTASAAEEVTGALRSILGGRCKIIGEKSPGNLLEAEFDPSAITKGFLVTYPRRESLMIDGTRIEELGITPEPVVNSWDTTVCLQEAKKWINLNDISNNTSNDGDTGVWIDASTVLIKGDADKMSSERLVEKGIDVSVDHVERCLSSNLCLIHLAKPVTNKKVYGRYFAPLKDMTTLKWEGHTFVPKDDKVYIFGLSEGLFLYGIRGWHHLNPHRVQFTQEVNDAINQMIIAQALKSR